MNSGGIPMRRRPANSRSALGLVDGRLALRLDRGRHMETGAIVSRACCCERFDSQGGELRIPQLLRPIYSAWPIVRERVKV